MGSFLQQIDLSLFRYINGLAGGWTLDRIIAYEEVNPLFKGGLFLVCYWIYWWKEDPGQSERRSTIAAAMMGTVLALIVNRTISAVLPFSQRPMFNIDIGYHPSSVPISYDYEEWSSFPSDTATYFFALAFGLYRVAPRLSLVLMGYAGVYVCAPRIYLGIHWPSDIILGALLGVVVVALAEQAPLRSRIGSTALAIEERYRSVFYPLMFLLSFEMAVMFDHVRDALRGIARALRHNGLASASENTFLFTVLIAGAVVMMLGAVVVAKMHSARLRTRAGSPAGLDEHPRVQTAPRALR